MSGHYASDPPGLRLLHYDVGPSYCHESDMKSAFEPTYKSPRQPHSTTVRVLLGEASVLQPKAEAENLCSLTV
jgi:hypothetical protein